ncbi:hypothetical protein M9Y10_044041 [Tritrichomonas musculus]|uniref:AAA-ATPase-like domain-containing protein n=1 Tax=Tritrichomonas musculus TaxID=1915356 RepID=A0ABR2K1E1_9EUKA
MSNEQQSLQYKVDINASFSEIASKSLFFIDKSIDALKLLQLNSSRIMILRPAKFGKSIIMDMVEDYFLQRIDSFQMLKCQILSPSLGLTFSKEKASTVIRLKLKTKEMTKDNYNEKLLGEIQKQFERYNIAGIENFTTPNTAFEHLIAETSCYGQKKVVILIDDIESILLFMKHGSPEFISLVSTIQSILDVLCRWKDSIKFLLLLGSANFCQVSNIVRDYTFRYEVAGIFGFNIADMINCNIFYNQIGDQIRLPETRVQYFGSFQKSLQSIYDFSVSDFQQIISTNLLGKISIEFLFYLILHSGNHKFAPNTNVYVINPVDFLCSMTESRIGTYWINSLLEQYEDSFFLAFPDGEDTIIKSLLKIVVRGNRLLKEDIPSYKHLIPLGFLSFKDETIVIPNLTILEFITNKSINYFRQRCANDYSSLSTSPFNNVLEKMPSFPEYKLLPSVVFKNGSWDYILFFFLFHVFTDLKIQVANDGTFLAITNSFILSLFFKGELELRLTHLERETTVPIILVKITITNVVCIETCFRQDNQIKRYKLDFWNPNYFLVPNLFPFLYTEADIANNPNNKSANKNQNGEKKEDGDEKGKNEEKKVDPNKLLSFSDIVKESLKDLNIRKSRFVTLNMILNDIVKKMPRYASDNSLEKSILLSLYYLTKTGYVEYRSNSQGTTEYSLVQFQNLSKVSV